MHGGTRDLLCFQLSPCISNEFWDKRLQSRSQRSQLQRVSSMNIHWKRGRPQARAKGGGICPPPPEDCKSGIQLKLRFNRDISWSMSRPSHEVVAAVCLVYGRLVSYSRTNICVHTGKISVDSCTLLAVSLYNQQSVSGCWNRLVDYPICQLVCLSGGCIVEKRLIGSGYCLEWWAGSVEGWVY